jgi:hypothetical protein
MDEPSRSFSGSTDIDRAQPARRPPPPNVGGRRAFDQSLPVVCRRRPLPSGPPSHRVVSRQAPRRTTRQPFPGSTPGHELDPLAAYPCPTRIRSELRCLGTSRVGPSHVRGVETTRPLCHTLAGLQSAASNKTMRLSMSAARATPSTEFTNTSSCSMLSVPSYPIERNVYTKSAQNVSPAG